MKTRHFEFFVRPAATTHDQKLDRRFQPGVIDPWKMFRSVSIQPANQKHLLRLLEGNADTRARFTIENKCLALFGRELKLLALRRCKENCSLRSSRWHALCCPNAAPPSENRRAHQCARKPGPRIKTPSSAHLRGQFHRRHSSLGPRFKHKHPFRQKIQAGYHDLEYTGRTAGTTRKDTIRATLPQQNLWKSPPQACFHSGEAGLTQAKTLQLTPKRRLRRYRYFSA
jgi:hypothetical protein